MRPIGATDEKISSVPVFDAIGWQIFEYVYEIQFLNSEFLKSNTASKTVHQNSLNHNGHLKMIMKVLPYNSFIHSTITKVQQVVLMVESLKLTRPLS